MTAAKRTETNEGEMERVPEPEVGLGAGASAAMAEPMRPQTAKRTSISEALETPIACCNSLNVDIDIVILSQLALVAPTRFKEFL
ncbi:hypothetical protein V6N13_144938 [Hibiscus sabdariffa]|uniref:Uncharacterized protein n=1 Tax=Hibiscus sabdariffa TaxID=183260 RepID=A0ABR2FM81_9ROSI